MKNLFKITKNGISIFLISFLILSLIYDIFYKTIGNVIDNFIFLIGLFIYLKLFSKTNQNIFSYSAFAFGIILHNLYLYPYSPLGIPFDHYMHFIGSVCAVIVVERIYLNEIKHPLKHFLFLLFIVSGLGSFIEILEWFGAVFLGSGDGLLLFGVGDYIEWTNSSKDMIFNTLGAGLMSFLIVLPKFKWYSKLKKIKGKKNKQKN